MKDDPIVAEVRAIRDELAAQCSYDLKKIFRQLRQQQSSSGRKYVAIRPVGSSPPKTGKHPGPLKRMDEQRTGRTMLTVINHLGDDVFRV